MKKSSLIIILRISFACFLLFLTGSFGFEHRSPFIILPLGLSFTVLYICGKWYVWGALFKSLNIRTLVLNIALTLPIQLILAALVYLIGLGVGRIFTQNILADSLSKEDFLIIFIMTVIGGIVSFLVHFLEKGKGPAAYIVNETINLQQNENKKKDNFDFKIIDEIVTKENLFSTYRSGSDYSLTALNGITSYDGSKPKYKPYAATLEMIESKENQLGFKFPDGLKAIYLTKNGGSVRDVMVAAIENPQAIYDHWKSAFGGYEDLHSLEQLRTVKESVLDYAYEDEEDQFPKGCEKMLILSQWYRETTFLDYRETGEPKVVMANFDDDNWEEGALYFKSFEAFFSQLKRIDSDFNRKAPEIKITESGPSSMGPDQFWVYDGSSADHGVDENLWKKTEKRLKVKLPLGMRPYFEACNGGLPYFSIYREQDQKENLDEDGIFPDSRLLGINKWISLDELSQRIDFTDSFTPWSEIWSRPLQLIVISAKYDSVLMLDYRNREEPIVILSKNINNPKQVIELGEVDKFLKALRAKEKPHWNDSYIGDKTLSARSSSLDSFWLSKNRKGLNEAEMGIHEKRLGVKFPNDLKKIMGKSNGGSVRFKFLPPVRPNNFGYLNPVPLSEKWFDIIPDGILPVEDWQKLESWLEQKSENIGEALRQKGYSQYVKDEFGDPQKVIVLAEKTGRLTLLDTSRSNNAADNSCLVQLSKSSDIWSESYRSPIFRSLKLRAKSRDLIE